MKYILVFIGGGLGASTRYFLTTVLADKFGNFPLGTLVINIIGSFLMGLVVGVLQEKSHTELYRLFIAVGFLGGFTTLSAFYAETFELIHEGQIHSVMVSVFGNLVVAFFACLVGLKIAHTIF